MKKHLLIYTVTALLLFDTSVLIADNTDPVILEEMHGKVPFLTLASEEMKQARSPIHPFLNSSLPKPNHYDGGLFNLNHDYPKVLPPEPAFPWKKVTNHGLITQENAKQYVEALKQYVSKDISPLIFDKAKVNNKNWYQSIWLGTEREPIHGMYVGSGFPANTLTNQKLDLTTYVFTLYDKRAAKTLGNIWGQDKHQAMNPVLTKDSTQYAEGSVIVKFAFVTSCGSDWQAMTDTAVWQIFAPLNVSNGSGHSQASKCSQNGANGNSTTPVLTNIYMMQFDIIVKDSIAAPETGWVFSTLVYDRTASGKDAWEKMVPLGATWGNNPDVINTLATALTPPVSVNQKLTENWINLDAPAYAKSTLGWDGRLSGPNDGAVVTPAWADGKYYHQGLASVGCLGCHSSAQYPMTAFLLPTTTYPPRSVQAPLSSDPDAKALVLAPPSSSLWMQWFQNRNGTTAMGPQTSKGKTPLALDYDMVTAFKAIPMWQAAVKAQK